MDKTIEYLKSPERDEAGTPNFFGTIATTRALMELDKIGFDKIAQREEKLRDKLLDGLSSIPKIINYGDMNKRDDRLGISVRQGWFCAHPYCRRLMHISEKAASAFIHNEDERMPGMIRVSFGIYNDIQEVEYFLNVIEALVKKI